MGYGVGDLFHFLRQVGKMPGVERILLVPYRHPVEVLVEVGGGLSEQAYDARDQIYAVFEKEFADYRVGELLDLEYRIIPIGEDISTSHIPDEAIVVPIETSAPARG